MVRALLECGVDPAAGGRWSETAVSFAVEGESREVLATHVDAKGRPLLDRLVEECDGPWDAEVEAIIP